MKTKLTPIFLLATLTASSVFAANYDVTPTISGDDYTYTGAANSSDRSTITEFVFGKNLILDSTGNEGTYRSGNITAKKLTAMNGTAKTGYVNIAGVSDNQGITVDIAEASGEIEAITAGAWAQNYTTTTVKNSTANSTATAIVNFDSLTLNSPQLYNKTVDGVRTAYDAQKTTLKFDSVKANVTVAGDTTISASRTQTFGKKATLAVTSSADVTWNGNMKVVSDGVLNVAGNLTLNNNLTLNKNAFIDIANNGKLEIKGEATFGNNMSDITITGNGVLKATGAVTFNGEMGTITEITYDFAQDTTADIGTTINSAITLGNGANWKAAGKLTVDGGHLTMNSGSEYLIATSNQDGRVILKNGTLTLNAEKAIVNSNGKGAAIATYDGTTNTIYVNENQDIVKIYTNNSILNVYMAENVTMDIGDINIAGNAADIRIYNFKEDTISAWETDTNRNAITNAVTLYDANNKFLGNAMLGADGFITLSIPEPAEWAAIFGAIALGLAMYRRRK